MKLEKYIEHTLLKQDATKKELIKLLQEALEHKFAGVCVNSSNVEFAKDFLKNTDIKVVSVVGFPLGACLSEVKAFEAKKAVQIGADEIDMVINVQSIKDKNYLYSQKDIETVKKAIGEIPLKVIIETDLLTKEEIVKACEIIKAAKADYAKTCTGFVKNGIGAQVEDIKLMRETLKNSNVKIKASGGIKDYEQAVKLIEAGASRIGTSSGVKLIKKS
ncbi:MAG: deoxyribose-phosphate aldolase [Candidatus Gastranaerophilales bacterium]|nr:deoxyribose-phosphate aldolase [Candidatus Gastranaerophilales bacterium]